MVKLKGDIQKYIKDKYHLKIYNGDTITFEKKYGRLKDIATDVNCSYDVVKQIRCGKMKLKKWEHIKIDKLQGIKIKRNNNEKIDRSNYSTSTE